MSKLQEKPSALKKEHPALQNIKFMTFFYVCGSFTPSWILNRIQGPNRDTDPDPQHCFKAKELTFTLSMKFTVVSEKAMSLLPPAGGPSMKYILVTGGVISGIGKGVVASSLGVILKHCGVPVTSIKIDPYINIGKNLSPLGFSQFCYGSEDDPIPFVCCLVLSTVFLVLLTFLYLK